MADSVKRKLPVRIESFEEIRKDDFYYIDKTAMIRNLLERWGKVNLFTRPRRFGKSLNMSMLKYFFETGSDPALFDGLEISKEKSLCEKYMGKFPVISVSMKSVDGSDYGSARSLLRSVIGKEAMRFRFLLKSDALSPEDKELYRQLINVDTSYQEQFMISDTTLIGSLKTLSELLKMHYGERVIILIDEYDVPLAKASEKGYYEEMLFLIRGILDQALKSNDSLYFAVLTGCLRVSKESIFTGLNNSRIFSITTASFDEYFGFTDLEVREILSYYNLDDKYNAVKEWYDGYLFGKADVYCPWDVISYCADAVHDTECEPGNYWSNTSGNDVVRRFIEKAGNGIVRGEIEALIAGETVMKKVYEDLTYNSLYEKVDHLWSVLFMTGYLTQRGRSDGNRYLLAIPNMEIRNIFTDQIMEMFQTEVESDGALLKEFCDALKNGEEQKVASLFSEYLKKTISIRDTFVKHSTKENFYHGILLGILGYKNDWYIKSNKESGDGYSDILAIVENDEIGIIIEVKYAQSGNYDAACRKAIAQIDDNEYAGVLKEEGCRNILKYGIACYKKDCRVVLERENVGDVS